MGDHTVFVGGIIAAYVNEGVFEEHTTSVKSNPSIIYVETAS